MYRFTLENLMYLNVKAHFSELFIQCERLDILYLALNFCPQRKVHCVTLVFIFPFGGLRLHSIQLAWSREALKSRWTNSEPFFCALGKSYYLAITS